MSKGFPKASRSEIFDLYAEIAEKDGLISTAADEKESKELKKYRDDVFPRLGSDDISTIEALYGLKPESTQEYENNIIEAAHPKSVVIAPSYDKINGLVENLNERSNIIRNIVMKPVDGALTKYKYAKNELIGELVRVANDLDNRNIDGLRILADTCIDNLVDDDIKKKAFDLTDAKNWIEQKLSDVKDMGGGALAGAVIGGLAGALTFTPFGMAAGAQTGAVAGALLAGLFKTAPNVENVIENCKDTTNQLSDLIKKLPQNKFLTDFNSVIENLQSTAGQYIAIIDRIKQFSLENKQPNSEDLKNSHDIGLQLNNSMGEFEKYKTEFYRRLDSGEFSAVSEHSKIMAPIYYFIDDDVDDVKDSLQSLEFAVGKMKETMKDAIETHNAIVENNNSRPQVPQNKTYTGNDAEKAAEVQREEALQDGKNPYKHDEPSDNNLGLQDMFSGLWGGK